MIKMVGGGMNFIFLNYFRLVNFLEALEVKKFVSLQGEIVFSGIWFTGRYKFYHYELKGFINNPEGYDIIK